MADFALPGNAVWYDTAGNAQRQHTIREELFMASDELPIPEPRGALVPPNRRPPTAVGADTAPPVPPGR